MKVLITGSNGFIGKNLISHLKEIDNLEIITFDVEDNFSKIESNIDSIDFIFHLAGINRPTDVKEFYEGNTDLTKKIVDLIKNKNIPILITSSIQATKDNDYGKSKKLAEDYIKENLTNYYIYRLHNVFGKWCKPNYNSVTATFCYNVANNLEITINDRSTELTLIYIDDIIYEFINVLNGNKPSEEVDNYYYINPRYNVTLGYMADNLYEFKNNLNSIYVPSTGNDFIKKLYSTFISYLDKKDLITTTTKNSDERGSFIELVRTKEVGQVSVSFSNKGVIRGNHYHHTKVERFIVIKGKARINFSSIINNDKYSIEVSDENIQIVTIPIGYTHNIENIGNDEMILVIWCNELFDKDRPDTYFKKVEE